jgi:hypothetical protein
MKLHFLCHFLPRPTNLATLIFHRKPAREVVIVRRRDVKRVVELFGGLKVLSFTCGMSS